MPLGVGKEHHPVTREDQVERSFAGRDHLGIAEQYSDRAQAASRSSAIRNKRGRQIAGGDRGVGPRLGKRHAGRPRPAADIERTKRVAGACSGDRRG